jgi:hypothetical protein
VILKQTVNPFHQRSQTNRVRTLPGWSENENRSAVGQNRKGCEVEPSYFVRAKRNRTSIRLPIYNVPELDKTVKASANATAEHLRRHGWHSVRVEAAS